MKLALFLGFFPQIMEGPISTYGQTAEAIFRCDPLRLENLSSGAVRILWGLFKKIVIADRLYTLVQAVFDNHENFGGVIVFIAATAYTAQLYMEFSGCIDIVIGSARMFGVRLPENFRQPLPPEMPPSSGGGGTLRLENGSRRMCFPGICIRTR